MATEKKQLKMKYRTASFGSVTQTLDDPKADLTGAEVETAMDNIIGEDVFTSNGGDLVAAASATLVITSETLLF